jgi:hypothetical protein
MRYLSADDVFVSEADGFANVVLRLSGPAEGTFTVNYSTSNGYASGSLSSDYTAVNSSVTFSPGETSKTIQIAITNNAAAESLEHFYLILTLPTASQTLATLARREIPVWIVDNDSTAGGTPIVSINDVAVDESTSPVARFAVTLDRPAAGTVTVNWATADGSAVSGQDFAAASGTVTFQPGDTAQTVEVTLTNDALAEGSEQFRVQLSSASGATIGQGSGVATIGANDAAVSPKPVLYADGVTVSEADGYAQVALRLDAPSNTAIQVNYSTVNGYASSSLSTDYMAINDTLTFAPGQTLHTVRVPINTAENAAEPLENFYLTLSVPSASTNFVTLSRSEIPVWIVDNDSTAGGTPIASVGDVTVDETTSQYARFVVTLDRPAAGIVTVNWATADGSAVAGQDFVGAGGTLTFLPGQTAQTAEVALVNDALAEGSEQFRVQLSAAAGATIGRGGGVATIGANDAAVSPKPVLTVDDVTVSEADGWAELVLRLDAPSNSQIQVNYSTSNGWASSSLSTDYIARSETVTFAPGQTVQTVKVPINTGDRTAETVENFYLNLSVPSASTNFVTLSRSEIPVWIVDNDSTAGGTPVAKVGDVTVDEATSQYARFAVTLDRPALDVVTIAWRTVDGAAPGGAAAGSDYVGASGTLVFLPSETAQTVEVELLDDALAEGPERFRLELTAASGATIGRSTGVATIGESDGPISPKPVLHVDDVTVSEADAYAELVLRLDAPSNSLITVNYSTSNGYASSSLSTDYIARSEAVTFAPGQRVQTVKVPINTGDSASERIENFYLNLSVPSASTNFVTLSRSEIPVWIVDNDSTAGGSPVVSVGNVTVDESTARYATFVVTLDRQSTSTVSVDWRTVDGSAVAPGDYRSEQGTVVFLPGETARTVSVVLLNDTDAEGAEQFRLELSAPVGATIGQGVGVATIGANDAQSSPKPVLFVDDVTVDESDAHAELVLRLDAPSTSPFTVNYFTSNGWASSSLSTDYIGLSSSVTFAPGQTVHTVKVPVNTNDSTSELPENFYLNLSLPTASQPLVSLSRTEIPVWIVDNDSTAGGTPIVSVRDVLVDEATSQYARFLVTLDRPSNDTVTVDWRTAQGSARDGDDFAPGSGTLTFLPGQTSRTIEVALVDDGLAEGAEEFDVALSNAVGAAIEVRSATARIGVSDGTPLPRPVLRVDDVDVSEASSYALMLLRLDAPSVSPITVNYFTSNVTASSSQSTDYIALNSSVTFAPGQTVHVVKVPITNDTTPEAQEAFNLNLSVPTASSTLVTLSRSQVPVVIVDDDSGFRVMDYGIGDDTYVVLAHTDRIIEMLGAGIDTAETALDQYTLTDNVEKLLLTGFANLRGFGNELENTMRGNPGANQLSGLAGNDTLFGEGGNDTLDGGAGIDAAAWQPNAAGHRLSFTPNGYVVQDLAGSDGTDTLTNVERLQFADKTIVVERGTPTQSYENLPVGLYHFFIVAFDAAPGVTYMDQLAEAYRFFQPQLGDNALRTIVEIFTTKTQFTDVYPTSLSNRALAEELVARIVKQSASDAAKSEAVGDIEGALGLGWTRGQVIFTVFGNLANKPFSDPTWGGTAQQFDRQIAVAKVYSEVLLQGTTHLQTLRDVLAPVTPTTDVSSEAKIVELIGQALLDGPGV